MKEGWKYTTVYDIYINITMHVNSCIKDGFFFLKWGCPSLCIEEMHTTFLYFNYLTKDWQEALQ
jgi:hypothetical protein